jgi:hypothetical protein
MMYLILEEQAMKIAKSVLAAGALVVCIGCAAGGKLQSMAAANMAEALKEFCKQHDIRTAETRAADSLYQVAVNLQKKGQQKDALAARDLAITHYKLALARRELSASEKRLEETRELLRQE